MSLEKLKELRKRRMEAASIALRKSKEYLLACEQELNEKQQEVQQYAIWQLQQQNTLFSQLEANSFSPNDLGKYQADIEELKVKKQQLEASLEVLKQKYQQAENTINNRKLSLSVITKKLEKLSEIIDIKKEEHSSGAGRKEEDRVDEIVAFRANMQ